MDFGDDPYFYGLMRDARLVSRVSYPEYAAYMDLQDKLRIERTPLYQKRLREYLDCMEHADELHFFGGRRRRPVGQRLRLEYPNYLDPLPGIPMNYIPFHFPKQLNPYAV